MDNLAIGAAPTPREQLARCVRNRHTWVMSFLYIGTFGSFIGYSAAMPLLIKLELLGARAGCPLGTGIYFAYYAFLGALVGSVTRPLRRLAGRQVRRRAGHPGAFGAMIARHAGWCSGRSPQLTPNPTATRPIAAGQQRSMFPWFLAGFLLHLRGDRDRQRLDVPDDPGDLAERGRGAATDAGTPERASALARPPSRPRPSSAIIGAVGALGGFLIPIAFGCAVDRRPAVDAAKAAVRASSPASTSSAPSVTWAVYLRRPSVPAGRAIDQRLARRRGDPR